MATSNRTCSFPGCRREARGIGLCGGHRQQDRRGQSLQPLRDNGIGQTAQERLDKFTDKSGECWLWTGSTYPGGYGQFYFQGKCHNAHRIAYILANGDVEHGEVVDHMCHNRRCVNPEHLQAVTVKENVENRGVLNSNNTSGARGVVWDKARLQWKAQFRHGGKLHFLGRFNSFAEAEDAVKVGRNGTFLNNLVDRGLNIA